MKRNWQLAGLKLIQIFSFFGPFYDGAGDLITDKSEFSQLLLEQFSSVFSTPSTDKKVTDPDSFFTYNIDGKPLLTDIIIDDEHIVSAVKEMLLLLSTHSSLIIGRSPLLLSDGGSPPASPASHLAGLLRRRDPSTNPGPIAWWVSVGN